MAASRFQALVREAALVSAGAWCLLILQDSGLFLPSFCAMTVLTPGAALASLDLALALNPPAKLAAGWALMLAAMMTPLLTMPLLHIHHGSLPRRRLELTSLYLIAYATVWMAAGGVLLPLAMLLRLAAPSPWIAFALASILVLTWHVSPLRQRCLNRRHARPPLPAFGARAAVAALRFGAGQGVWCVGACWGLMLLPLVLPHGHLGAMAAVALWQFAEHLEAPASPTWRWRWPERAARIFFWGVRNLWGRPTAAVSPRPLD